MYKLDQESLTLIAQRLEYYQDGDEVDTITAALGLVDEEDKMAHLVTNHMIPIIDNQFDQGLDKVNTAIIMVAFVDMVAEHSDSTEELFCLLTTGWSSVMDYIQGRAKKLHLQHMLKGLFGEE